MLSGILFINTKGELIISRFYRDDIRHAADVFKLEVLNSVDASAGSGAAPVRYINDDSYMYIRHKDMYVVAITKKNSNAVMIFQYLYELLEVLKAYFGNEFDEDKLRDNFVLVYELLDETMDYGYPQLVTPDVLKEFIKIGSVKDEYQPKSAGGVNQPITTMITGTCDWRPEGKYKYRKNEVFLDVLESINLLMSSQGAVLRTDVAGKIVMKCFLTGMPECKFGLNDKLMLDNKSNTSNNSGSVAASNSAAGSGIAIDDIVFHRCVRLGKFEADRTISFVPPDGEFELMKYRITQNIYLPFSVIPVITEHGRTRIEYEIKVKANFTDKLFANNVVVRVPTPKNAAKYKYTAGSGTLEYLPTEHCLEWKIERFAGNTSLVLKAEVNMTASIKEKAWSRPPITMDFQVPMYTSSGLHVRFLKVFEKSNYQTIKWVRYITKAGRYEIRI
jgi:AP-2 complex subunit mu-1